MRVRELLIPLFGLRFSDRLGKSLPFRRTAHIGLGNATHFH